MLLAACSSTSGLDFEGSLRRALGRHEFLLHYQPKISLESGEITGVEALIRWMHPDRGLVPPSQFVPIAEVDALKIDRSFVRDNSIDPDDATIKATLSAVR